jgi:hypothetical protein
MRLYYGLGWLAGRRKMPAPLIRKNLTAKLIQAKSETENNDDESMRK